MQHCNQLEALPAELVLCVFDWVCCEEIDLNMLSVSHRIRSMLLLHPVILMLAAFHVQTCRDTVKLIGRDMIVADETSAVMTTGLPVSPFRSIRDIVKMPWCTDQYVAQIQRAMLRTMIRVHWAPYLRRDGKLRTPKTLEDILSRVMTLCHDAGQGPNGMLTIFDTTIEYSWTRVHVWPLDGRVVIRDQVSNTSKELHVAIISQIELARLTCH